MRMAWIWGRVLLVPVAVLGLAYHAHDPAPLDAAPRAPAAPDREIDPLLYIVLQSDLQDVPGLRGPIGRAIADGRITHSEYKKLRQLKTRVDPTDAKLALRYQLTRSTAQWNSLLSL